MSIRETVTWSICGVLQEVSLSHTSWLWWHPACTRTWLSVCLRTPALKSSFLNVRRAELSSWLNYWPLRLKNKLIHPNTAEDVSPWFKCSSVKIKTFKELSSRWTDASWHLFLSPGLRYCLNTWKGIFLTRREVFPSNVVVWRSGYSHIPQWEERFSWVSVVPSQLLHHLHQQQSMHHLLHFHLWQHTHMLFGFFLVDYDISLYDMLAHLLTRRRKSIYEGWLMFDSYQHLLSTTASLRSAESTGPVLPLQTDIQHVWNQSAWRGRLSTPKMTCMTVRDRWQVNWSLVITWLSNSCSLVGGGTLFGLFELRSCCVLKYVSDMK